MAAAPTGTSSDRRPSARGRPARRHLALLAGVLLVLAACGDPEVVVDDVEESVPEPEAEPEQQDVPDDADEEEPAEPEEDADEGGLAEHRPPAEAEALADCDAIDELDPGAVLVFPSDEDPAWLDAGDGPVTVGFIGCSNTFEANLEYEAYHGQDATPTLEGFTMGGSYGDWAEFGFEETFWTPGEWTVVVFEIDAASGERREYDEVTFTVG